MMVHNPGVTVDLPEGLVELTTQDTGPGPVSDAPSGQHDEPSDEGAEGIFDEIVDVRRASFVK